MNPIKCFSSIQIREAYLTLHILKIFYKMEEDRRGTKAVQAEWKSMTEEEFQSHKEGLEEIIKQAEKLLEHAEFCRKSVEI